MKEQIKIALWNKVKSTYPSGTSKHTNALLEEDFESFIDEVVKICATPAVISSACDEVFEQASKIDIDNDIDYGQFPL